jgi:tetratricopeptide (TPR) repeat protein
MGRNNTSPRRGRYKFLLSIAAVVLVAAGLGAWAYIAAAKSGASTQAVPTKKQILSAWAAEDRPGVYSMTKAALEAKPLDPFFLSFNGISAYYLSFDKSEGEERQGLLEESVTTLRKALASGKRIPVKSQVEYVLGKAYYQKGAPWHDLAAKYLEASVKDGYKGKDTDQFLGLIYAGLEEYENAVAHFEKALQSEPSDLLMLSAAISYNELGNKEKADELLKKVSDSSPDGVAAQRARFLIGERAMENGDPGKALAIFEKIVQVDPRSAEGWYRLGLVYEALKDPIKARAAWRKVTAIDPSHVEARKKLAEKL